jgi:hypothetical protein
MVFSPWARKLVAAATGLSSDFLYNEQKVHMSSTWEPGGVWNDRDNLTFQTVQKSSSLL